MEVHVGAAIAAVPFVVWHVAARRIRVRPTDLSRRNSLRGGALVAEAAAGYAGTEILVRATGMPGAERRFTGSYEAGSYVPDQMPVSSWMFDAVPQIKQSAWRLSAGGRDWSYDELFAYDDRLTATLDCTGGFFSTQEWAGIRLDRLIGKAEGASVRVRSATGYDRRFPIERSSSLLLATRFGGQKLIQGTGFRHAWSCLKGAASGGSNWVSAIEVDDVPHWWQPPFPLQ
jgi:DMSO/TMAO reductase YedYZ molybdopterin-dependent catalytic subunit